MTSDVGRLVPGSVKYDGLVPESFARSREFTEEGARAWQSAVLRHVRPADPCRLLDLGSGTGRFSSRLAEWLHCSVIAVEPAEPMRAVARRARGDAPVHLVAGSAEHIPLARSVDVAWMSNVIHHVPNRDACAVELRRVVHDGGCVMIAGAFGDRLEQITLFDYFPEARRVAEQFPTLDAVIRMFERAGFREGPLERVVQKSCGSLREAAERTVRRSDTTLRLISDEAFARGQRALEAAAAAESSPSGVYDGLDLLVLHA